MYKQRGGTLLGIIIGLIIGLGIALAVAVMITKTPMPFMDKSGRQKPIEPTAQQSADPNRPLYGKKVVAAKDAAAAAVMTTDPAPPANTAAPQADKRETRVEPAVAAPAAPVANPARPKAAEATDDKWNYYLQAGAFRVQSDAESMRAKLALMGVEAKISERQSENGTLYRVRIGPYAQLEAMNKARAKLSENGVDAAVVRIAK